VLRTLRRSTGSPREDGLVDARTAQPIISHSVLEVEVVAAGGEAWGGGVLPDPALAELVAPQLETFGAVRCAVPGVVERNPQVTPENAERPAADTTDRLADRKCSRPNPISVIIASRNGLARNAPWHLCSPDSGSPS
jgi:hypothetical protein